MKSVVLRLFLSTGCWLIFTAPLYPANSGHALELMPHPEIPHVEHDNEREQNTQDSPEDLVADQLCLRATRLCEHCCALSGVALTPIDADTPCWESICKGLTIAAVVLVGCIVRK